MVGPISGGTAVRKKVQLSRDQLNTVASQRSTLTQPPHNGVYPAAELALLAFHLTIESTQMVEDMPSPTLAGFTPSIFSSLLTLFFEQALAWAPALGMQVTSGLRHLAPLFLTFCPFFE